MSTSFFVLEVSEAYATDRVRSACALVLLEPRHGGHTVLRERNCFRQACIHVLHGSLLAAVQGKPLGKQCHKKLHEALRNRAPAVAQRIHALVAQRLHASCCHIDTSHEKWKLMLRVGRVPVHAKHELQHNVSVCAHHSTTGQRRTAGYFSTANSMHSTESIPIVRKSVRGSAPWKPITPHD